MEKTKPPKQSQEQRSEQVVNIIKFLPNQTLFAIVTVFINGYPVSDAIRPATKKDINDFAELINKRK